MHIEEFLALPAVRTLFAEKYQHGVRSAIEGYPHARADEDTVTGALGQALLGRGAFQLEDRRVVTWSTSYTRFASAGKKDPAETRYGADGIFEIELKDDDGLSTRKSLLFQAKKEANTFGAKFLRKQAKQIASVPGGGIVIDYRPGSFVAVDARAVALREENIEERPLADVLARDFVGCTKGSSAHFFDPDRETLSFLTAEGHVAARRLPLHHRIKTRCVMFTLG